MIGCSGFRSNKAAIPKADWFVTDVVSVATYAQRPNDLSFSFATPLHGIIADLLYGFRWMALIFRTNWRR